MARSWSDLHHWKNGWRPREGKPYYHIWIDGKIHEEIWKGINNSAWDENNYKDRNIFETIEEAEKSKTEVLKKVVERQKKSS